MSWPIPRPGLVIRYSYLWADDAERGMEEGVKDRPCAIIMAVATADNGTRVLVLPVTHSEPTEPNAAMELPQTTKRRLGLDDARSWIVLSEFNVSDGQDLTSAPSPAKAPNRLQSVCFRDL